MRASYGRVRISSVSWKRIVIAAGLFLLPAIATLEEPIRFSRIAPPSLEITPAPDTRILSLQRFLNKLHCPVATLASDFIQAADENQLDWRLLPSISVIESSGGKQYRNNNVFGWNQGLEVFPSIEAGLKTVAFKLGRSSLYRHRDVLGKLRLYNPDEQYPCRVMSVMKRISPVKKLNLSACVPPHSTDLDSSSD